MNKVILIGRIARDIDVRFTPGNGMAIAKFSLAVNRRTKEKGADFISCIAFGKTGEIIAQHFIKGSAIAIEGHLKTDSYEAKDGTKRYTTDVIIDNFDFVEKKKADDIEQVNNDKDMPW